MSGKIKVSPDGLGAAISAVLAEYQQQVREELFEAMDTVADELVENLKRDSPDDGLARKNKYNKQWKKKVEFQNNLEKRVTVHNDKAYQLTHLLEDGHATVNGGRVAARVHIQPNADKAAEAFEQKAVEAVTAK